MVLVLVFMCQGTNLLLTSHIRLLLQARIGFVIICLMLGQVVVIVLQWVLLDAAVELLLLLLSQ